jgi:hypothetical protein
MSTLAGQAPTTSVGPSIRPLDEDMHDSDSEVDKTKEVSTESFNDLKRQTRA